MPIPLILGAIAIAAGVGGVAAGVSGAKKMKEANDTMGSVQTKHNKNLARFEKHKDITTAKMDTLGTLELEILNSFQEFSEVFEKIKNKPVINTYDKNGAYIPAYNAEDLKQVSIGAGVLLGGVGGAAVGTAGGFAAAGATTAAVMALGTASTGTAIASLGGVAATNATLALLGGGTLAAGGGGMALGTALLGGATLGIGLLVGGVIFNITGSSLSEKADEALAQMEKAEKEIKKICTYLKELAGVAEKYTAVMMLTNRIYIDHLNALKSIISIYKKTNYENFSEEEKLVTENTALLVNLLFNMCKVELVVASDDEKVANSVNTAAVKQSISSAETFIEERGLA